MPTNEQTALALGFYNYGDSIADELENGEFDDFVDYVDDDFESFDDDEDDGFMIEGDDEFMIEGDDEFNNVITDGDDWIGMGDEDFLNAHHSKKKIRGGGKDAFKLRGSHHINFNEDGEIGLEGGDDEFDNLLSKKGRKRRKKRREKRREYKKQGMSRKEARKKARKEARAEIPRDTLKETAKKSWKKTKKIAKKVGKAVGKVGKAVGKVVMKGAMFVPRQAGRGLVQLNYRGIAEKLKKGQEQKKYKDKIKKKWTGMGGSMKSLNKAINKGANKKPLLCGVKCKQKLHDKVKANFTGFDGEPMLDKDKLYALLNEGLGYSGFSPDPATLTMISTGAGVVGTLAGVVSGIKASKQNQEAIDNQKELDDAQLQLMDEGQKKEFELMEKKINAELSPEQQIMSNPDLTPQEKVEAVAQVREVMGNTMPQPESDSGKIFGLPKMAVILGGVAVVGLGIFAMTRRN